MAAGLGFKDFVTGEVLTAADVDGYLMQGVWVFASAAARDAAVTSPQEGNFAYLKDTNVTTYYTGSAWANLDTTGMTNPMTTTGDTIYSSSGSTPARLGIGSTGQVLTVAAGIPSWATPAGGGSGMTLLSTTTLSGASTTISSISQDYVNLLILVNSVDCTNASGIQVTFNAVNQTLGYAGAATVSPSGAFENAGNNNFIELRGSQHNITASNTDNVFSVIINNYASSTYRKTFSGESYFFGSSANQAVVYGGGTTMTTAISSLKFATTAGTFNAGTVLLYGVK